MSDHPRDLAEAALSAVLSSMGLGDVSPCLVACAMPGLGDAGDRLIHALSKMAPAA